MDTKLRGRLQAKVIVNELGCWVWQGALSKGMYPDVRMTVAPNAYRNRAAHRVAYEEWIGPIPAGLVLDHFLVDTQQPSNSKCVGSHCINPNHLKPVTGAENSSRAKKQTHCKNGHEFVEGSYYTYKHGGRGCKQCKRDNERKARQEGAVISVRGNVAARLMTKVTMSNEHGCWEWTGSTGPRGYGSIRMVVDGKSVLRGAHRVSYEHFVGPVPEGRELDHHLYDRDQTKTKCVGQLCINPEHLQPLTHAENTLRTNSPWAINARKTHCVNGHALNDDTIYSRPNTNSRECNVCKKNRTSQIDVDA